MISIVTPTLNQAETLVCTIESVLSQSYPDVELLVVDGGSTDGTLNILQRYSTDPRVRWWSERDNGQSHAINFGLARCRGNIFNWLNSDDSLERDALKKVAGAFAKTAHIDIVSGQTDEFRHETGTVFNRSTLQIRARSEETVTVGVFCQPSTFWRTEVVRKLGGVREDLHYCMDTDIWMRYLVSNGQDRVLKIKSLLARYRHHKNSKTSLHSADFYLETDRLFDALNLQLSAPHFFQAGPHAVSEMTSPSPSNDSFDRTRYFGCFCERQVRIKRREDPRMGLRWLLRSMRYRPWITAWRVKMLFRLLGRSSLASFRSVWPISRATSARCSRM